jgi:ParB-like chromosome segregation protein Spo0J
MPQDLIPFAPTQTTQRAITPQQRQHRTTLIDAAKMLNEIGWGNQGDIEGIEESVPLREVWLNPLSPIRYSDEDVDRMTGSLQAQGQLQPITVTYVDESGTDADGVPRGHLMIIDGGLRFLGACGADWDQLRAIVKPYRSMAEVMLELTTVKLSERELKPRERGMLILRSRLAYEHEREAFAARGEEHPMKRFYTQQQLAKRWGCSQSSIHNWLELAMQPMAILTLLDTEKLEEAQAIELMRYPDEAGRIDYAKKLARRNARKRVSSKRVRGEMLQLVPEPKPITLDASPLPYERLWSTAITEDTATIYALGCLLHDAREVLAAMPENGKRPHPALQRLANVLADPAIIRFVQEIEASA